LMLMGHGTKSPRGQAQFLELVDLARQRFDGQVQGGFIELAQPSMFEAVDELARSGINDLIIAPVILLPAGHLKDDAAELARHVRANWPNISVHLASDLGTNNELLDCFNQRINVVSDDADGILVVGRGSTDATANAELHAITRLIAETRDYPITQTAFISLAPPTVTAGLEQLVKLGAHHIVVAPYFLFHGVLLDRIAQEALRWGADTGHRITVSAELGPDPLVLDALWLRIREASGEHVRTSCDTCLYRRTTLPLGTSA
jgi:sirohydrochlorin cobaltochelatase